MWCQLRKWGNLGTRGILILVLLGWSALQTETAMSNNVGNPFIRDACNRTKTCGPRTLQDKSEEFWGMVSWPTPEDFFFAFWGSSKTSEAPRRHLLNCWLSPRIRTRQCTERPGIARRQPRWGSSQLRWGFALRARFRRFRAVAAMGYPAILLNGGPATKSFIEFPNVPTTWDDLGLSKNVPFETDPWVCQPNRTSCEIQAYTSCPRACMND